MKWILKRGLKKEQQAGMVGVHETPTSIAAVYTLCDGVKAVVKTHFFHTTPDASERQTVLEKFVNEHKLQEVACTCVLPSGEYSLNLVDMPAVVKEEVPQAMRWIIKDLISFPIEEAVIDTFELPFLRVRDNVKMAYAAVVRKERVARVESLIEAAGLRLKFVDIPELVLRNILVRQPEYSKGCVFLQLDPKGGKLILCREGQICTARTFDLKLEALVANNSGELSSLEPLALEIQRAFDYLNSVFRQSIPNIIILAPTVLNKEVIETGLKNALGAELYFLKLVDFLSFDNPFLNDEEETQCLLALGASLREEKVSA